MNTVLNRVMKLIDLRTCHRWEEEKHVLVNQGELRL